jgi:signal transduction histidine kinase/ActR/RegA family two-component response regulator
VFIVLGLVGSMHLAFRGFLESETERKRLNEELEYRVLGRTAELESANIELRREAESRVAAEAQVRQMQKMEAVGQLTGGIAHDFNNMLAVIVGSLDIARRSLPTDTKKVERFIQNALEGAQRGAQLTSRLLAFSRQQSLDAKPLDANRLVREMSELLMRTLGENVRLETVLAPGLWLVCADSSQLESVVVNLCVNSRDAMSEGGRLTLETMNAHLDDDYTRSNADVKPGHYVAIAVTDTGSGMSPEVAARAFDPFFTTKPAGQGTGLGLSQAYGFVRQSGGHIKIYSEPGKGTTVCIYLPRHLGDELQPIHVPPLPAVEPGAVNQENILVVEDEDRVRTMTVEALRSLGYQVVAAEGPLQALEVLVRLPQVDLLFTDIVMPGMDGRALAQAVLSNRPDIKVLYTTGYTRNSSTHNNVQEYDAALLRKPFTIEQLATKVRQVLDASAPSGSAFPVL